MQIHLALYQLNTLEEATDYLSSLPCDNLIYLTQMCITQSENRVDEFLSPNTWTRSLEQSTTGKFGSMITSPPQEGRGVL